MQRLYVLYDARCGLCSRARRWAEGRPAFVALEFVRSDSPGIERVFPGLRRGGPSDELVVISDEGAVYREGAAWIMCLYALEEFRELSLRLAHPALQPLARGAFGLISKSRRDVSRWLGLLSDADLVEALRPEAASGCELPRVR